MSEPCGAWSAWSRSATQWAACKDLPLDYSDRDTWDSMLQQGVRLLERFTEDGRVEIRRPRSHQQIQFNRKLSAGNSFVGFVDAIGELDDTACVPEWKTSSARYPTEPDGIAALDPQLICYSWMTGIDQVAQVVFVRKRLVEVQYLRATISDQQRLIYFKVYRSQTSVIERAIETAALMLGSDKSRGCCLEMICADFLAGAHLDEWDPAILLQSISRYYQFLPRPQREIFLSEVNGQP